MHTSTRLACTTAALAALASPALSQYSGEWPLDGINPGIATDISGNGNDGTLMNFAVAPWVPGVFGNAIAFDGIDDHVMTAMQTAPVYDGLGSPYSVSFWVKAPPQSNKFVYAEGSTSSNNPIILFGSGLFAADTDKFRVLVRNSQNQVALQGISNAVVFDGTWHHVVFVDNSGDCACYVDGVLDSGSFVYAANARPGMPGHGSYPLDTATMGALRRGSVCCYMQGDVDDLRVYRFAMTPLEVQLAALGAPVLPPAASIGEYGLGCGAGPLDIAGSGSAQLGGTGIRLDVQAGQPGSLALLALGLGAITPLDLAAFGYVGCTLYPSNALTLFAGVVDAAGTVPATTVPVPSNPALLMERLSAQAVAFVGGSLEFSDVVLATLAN